MSEPRVGDALAEAALETVRSGMIIGLGAGRTSARGIRALGDRVRLTGLDIACVCASEASEALARELGLAIADFALLEKIDLLIDGADEVDRSMRVLKGSRGAVSRERMLCWASERTVFMVSERKVTEQIGSQATLAIAFMPFGMTPTRNAIRQLGLNGVVRVGYNGDYFITDNGNLILDVSLAGGEDLADLAASLNDIPGVVDHGLFLNEADLILIEHEGGNVERLDRMPPARG